jgi:hydrogenase maturation protease
VSREAIVIGVGTTSRSDDGIGAEVAARVRALSLRNVAVVESAADPELMGVWTPADEVVLIDAVVSGATPGTVICRDVTAQPLPAAWFALSSHHVGVAETIELARALGRLPSRLVVVGVEAGSLAVGFGLTPAVAAAVEPAVAAVRAELRRFRRRIPPRRRAGPPSRVQRTPARARA